MQYTNALPWIEVLLFERFGHTFHLAQNVGQIVITLPNTAGQIEIVQGSTDFAPTDGQVAMSAWNAATEGWHTALVPTLPAPGVASLPSPLIEQTANGFRIHYDILGLTCWMLSRQEEVGRMDLDDHGRFPATASHAFRHGYLERPVVDEWLHILGQVIQRTWPGIVFKCHAFNMKVSHDVDGPSRYAFRTWAGIARSMAGDVVRRRDVRSARIAPWVKLNSKTALHPADPANTFDWIMDVSERHGMISAFYFICGRTDASKDADYEPEHQAIRELMRRIHRRGHEIGLHPSYATYQRPSAIVAEAKRLRDVTKAEGIHQEQWGGRMHFLRWEHPTTLNGWEQAGMNYDSTLSYADRPGFRCGTCFEYPAFDPVAGIMLKLRIRPLIAMECTVMAQRCMGLGTGEAAAAKFAQLKDACRSVGGCFTLLWHNSQFDTAAERGLYQHVIAH